MRLMSVAFTCVLAFTLPIAAQQIQVSKDNRTIAITTEGQASALADTAVVSIGFRTYGKDQDATYAQATQTSNAILAALTAAGVPRAAIASTDQRLTPLAINGDDDKARYAEGLRFEFNQSWNVTVPAAQAGDALHLAVLNGANDSGGIDWQLKDADSLQAEAASHALAHARQIAQGMATGLGARLGGLVYASNETPPRGLAPMAGGGPGFSMSAAAASVAVEKRNLKPLAIAPERIEKSATVYAVFAIE